MLIGRVFLPIVMYMACSGNVFSIKYAGPPKSQEEADARWEKEVRLGYRSPDSPKIIWRGETESSARGQVEPVPVEMGSKSSSESPKTKVSSEDKKEQKSDVRPSKIKKRKKKTNRKKSKKEKNKLKKQRNEK